MGLALPNNCTIHEAAVGKSDVVIEKTDRRNVDVNAEAEPLPIVNHLTNEGRWECACLLEIQNFSPLRRIIGRSEARYLINAIIEMLNTNTDIASCVLVGQSTAEIWLSGKSFQDLEKKTSKIALAFANPFEFKREHYILDIGIGAAAAPSGTTNDVSLLEEAESVLSLSRGEHRRVLRDVSAGTAAFDRFALTRELPSAIVNGEMFLQYQPKVHVRKNAIESVEALIRWQHPSRGLIFPGEFITVAEEANQIKSLTLWTLDRVIADHQILVSDGHDLTIFINISAILLADADFVRKACKKVLASDAKIGFEITETAVIRDPECAISNLITLSRVGIKIAIDDYGAGLSSLAYLKKLPATELKIDKMFVSQLTSSNRDPLIVRSTIDLAHALDMEVTAEGVETQAAMALLSVMGCDMIQGYLISRPIDIGPLREFLQNDINSSAEQVRKAMFTRPAALWKSV